MGMGTFRPFSSVFFGRKFSFILDFPVGDDEAVWAMPGRCWRSGKCEEKLLKYEIQRRATTTKDFVKNIKTFNGYFVALRVHEQPAS